MSTHYYQNCYRTNQQNQPQQQYSTHQAAPASNTASTVPKYQQPACTATSQATDYLAHRATQQQQQQQQHQPSYGTQTPLYGNQQSSGPWTRTDYGGDPEQRKGAAELQSNLSNTAHSTGTNTAVTSPSFTPSSIATSARYTGISFQAQQQQNVAGTSHTARSFYGQTEARPRNTNSAPAQRTQAIYNQQQQRSASPVPKQYAYNIAESVNSTQPSNTNTNANMGSTAQYAEYNRQQLPIVDTSRPAQNTNASTAYSNKSITASEQYGQTAITVDPTAVYDPSPEYERQRKAVEAQKVTEDAHKAVEARKEEEEEARRANQTKRAEEERITGEESRKADEHKQAEEKRTRDGQEDQQKAAKSEARKAEAQQRRRQQENQHQPSGSEVVTAGFPVVEGSPGNNDLEQQIRAMMAKMRELNSKDPALLARIWEEERRAKAPSSPIQSGSTPQPPLPQPKAQVAQSKKATVRPDHTPSTNGTSIARGTPQSMTQPSAVRPQPAISAQTNAPPPAKLGGSTIWPLEKKASLAAAAAAYLNEQNPHRSLTAENIHSILNGNPSYIGLCEILELMGLKLDRAAFARSLLTAVPDINAGARQSNQAQNQGAATSQRPTLGGVAQSVGQAQRLSVPPRQNQSFGATSMNNHSDQEYLRNKSVQPAASLYSGPAVQSPYLNDSYSPYLNTDAPAPAPLAQMIPINRPQFKPPANKEEAARKRTFTDVIDLTQLNEEDDLLPPPPKRLHTDNGYSMGSPAPVTDLVQPYESVATLNFHTPIPTGPPQPAQTVNASTGNVALPATAMSNGPKPRDLVQPIDPKKALRRNAYNIKTIARDVLLACGRHPEERQLNQHLEMLKTNLLIDNTSDLSTIRWDLIDPGQPPKGYYKDHTPTLKAGDANVEEDSDDDVPRRPQPQVVVQRTVGVNGAGDSSVNSFPTSNNLSKNLFKRGGRPPRNSFPMANTTSTDYGHGDDRNHRSSSSGAGDLTPRASLNFPNRTDSAPRPASASVNCSAFRSATVGPDGTPVKKRGRPGEWQKAAHGSEAAQAQTQARSPNPHYIPKQSSSLRNVMSGNNQSAMSSVSKTAMKDRQPLPPSYLVFKCQWQNCKAELHNMDTLRKHVHKVHRKPTLRGTLECLWDGCGREVTSVDSVTGIRAERQTPWAFAEDAKWREHLEVKHFRPLSWQLGDGPASGLSDVNNDSASESYLSDAQGRRVTPRVVGRSTGTGDYASPYVVSSTSSAGRGRGRTAKAAQEGEAREALRETVAMKKRIGGPGIDRGGATLANNKRRRGFMDNNETEEELVDTED
ncbi:hypothetical protein GQ43DRAFT_479652 [Delitschia confertaspora ATCC 74209]|uniref:C2H2-type domain-containing protein n=1 Tax=Delitschia confertaspora ATCC 74209 TaxID=1513339 RepID=A0A9P4JQW2_9PLEO|nr:hypothetical protein GQ43DRAFT_479652 [Delitschia confertaspora ATCC 74209]